MSLKLNDDLLELKCSQFGFSYEQDKILALYHSIKMQVTYVNNFSFKIFNLFKKGNNVANLLTSFTYEEHGRIRTIISKLVENDLLVPKTDSEERHTSYFNTHGEVDIRLMYVFPTDVCNMDCKYCFLERAFPNDYKFTNMGEDVLQQGINLFFRVSNRKSGDKRRILFYGGEPVINKSILRKGFRWIREHPRGENTEIHLITNGTLITEEFAKVLKDFNVAVSLSIDGPQKVHDAARVYLDGRGSYRDVRKGYENLRKAGFNGIGISLTVGNHNARDLRQHVEKLLNDFDVKGIGFNFLVDLPSGKNPLHIDIGIATEGVLDAFDLIRQKGIYEERIMRKLKPFVEETIHLKDCGAIGNQIVLAPNGRIGPCHAFIYSNEYFNHDVREHEIDFSKDPVYQEWSKRMPVNIEACHECPAIGVCGGGCPYQAKLQKGSIWELDDRMCVHNKKFLEWAIWDAYRHKAL